VGERERERERERELGVQATRRWRTALFAGRESTFVCVFGNVGVRVKVRERESQAYARHIAAV